jgi:hypothetical protein
MVCQPPASDHSSGRQLKNDWPPSGTFQSPAGCAFMDYTRTDIVLMIISTISVAVFLGYVAFGPTN